MLVNHLKNFLLVFEKKKTGGRHWTVVYYWSRWHHILCTSCVSWADSSSIHLSRVKKTHKVLNMSVLCMWIIPFVEWRRIKPKSVKCRRCLQWHFIILSTTHHGLFGKEDVFKCACMTIDHMGISISDRKHWDSKEALQKSSSNAQLGDLTSAVSRRNRSLVR